jgi:shikimate kinase
MKLFLIGFMGSGKTHWGRLLAENAAQSFYDLDEEIVKQEQLTVQQIFQEKGEEYFRFKEKEMLEALIEDHPNIIIACGGGTPCFFNNIELMKKSGKVLWLNTHIDTLVRRLTKQKHLRPLVKNISDDDLKAFIVRKMQERKIYYEQADIMVHEEVVTLEDLYALTTNANNRTN